jgi:hypothetical protein
LEGLLVAFEALVNILVRRPSALNKERYSCAGFQHVGRLAEYWQYFRKIASALPNCVRNFRVRGLTAHQRNVCVSVCVSEGHRESNESNKRSRGSFKCGNEERRILLLNRKRWGQDGGLTC